MTQRGSQLESQAGPIGSQTLKEQVEHFTCSPRLSIAKPLRPYSPAKCFTEIPRHHKMHWRGLWFPRSGQVYGMFRECDDLLPAAPSASIKRELVSDVDTVLCHCKPVEEAFLPKEGESKYPDIPDRLDIYLLLRHQFSAIAFAGRSVAAVIRRTEESFPVILRLRDWEADRAGGRYRRSRGRSQLRRALGREPAQVQVDRQHATSALRALGLHWPARPHERHAQWADCLRGIGLAVEKSAHLGPVRHYTISTKVQSRVRGFS